MGQLVRTREQIVVDVIRGWNEGQLGRKAAVVDMLQRDLPTWSIDKIGRALDSAVASPHQPICISTAQSLVYSGSDRSVYEKSPPASLVMGSEARHARRVCIRCLRRQASPEAARRMVVP